MFPFSVRTATVCALALILVCDVSHSKPSASYHHEDALVRSNLEEGEYFQGDIELGSDPSGLTKAGLVDENSRWPNKTLVYQISSDFSDDQVDLIKAAIDELAQRTCIKFTNRTTETDYVHLIKEEGSCSSKLGRIGGEQTLKLADGCFNVGWGTVCHELIHALGFVHEQARTDRDDFVTINWDNIAEDKRHNFDKYDETVIDPFGVSYDYASIMHYTENAFAIDSSQPTIVVKKEGAQIGQRQQLSEKDVTKLRNMYKCD